MCTLRVSDAVSFAAALHSRTPIGGLINSHCHWCSQLEGVISLPARVVTLDPVYTEI